MASDGGQKGKIDFSEENRTDSGIESIKSLPKDDQYAKTIYDSVTSNTDAKDKLDSVTEERVDSAYASSSLTVESLEDYLKVCRITSGQSGENTETSKSIEEEVNLLSTITEDGDTILHLAIIHEETDFSRQLIQLFPKDVLDIQNNLYQAPLHLATYLNQPSVVQDLMKKGACLELQDQDGNTPLHVACEQGRGECASEMIHEVSSSKLAHVLEMQNWRGLTCLHIATQHRHHRLMKLLMKKGVNLNIQEGTSGKTPLHIAVEIHDTASVNLLLNKGANVDAAMFNGCTALHLAVGRQDATIANLLCQSGADKMIRNIEDETALDLADGNDDILALFPFDDIQIMGRTVGVNF
ncbi:NF-kappa-B inhibitor epsilon [Chanos chanos]|uniref:NF-kappa-B inhibitor epsilon n=1 Tax=Chanos chanos TaxID=29144 RepID=A0A6J2V640_CHACN|nr:NF-kappa-B inhibitor epsilon [Chanos chanos]